MNELILKASDEDSTFENAIRFCVCFCGDNDRPKYIFGRNVYVEKVIEFVDVDGFVDDFSDDEFYYDRPVIKTEQIPEDALVLIVAGGRPQSAKQKIRALGFDCLDYFEFYKWSGLPLTDVVFNEGFAEDFQERIAQYEWIYSLFVDDTSKETFKKLVSFRLNYNLEFLNGFTAREDKQYFEDFLELDSEGEVFVDVGVFDGYTSLEFIKHCPKYRAIHLFEPDPKNFDTCTKNLHGHDNIYLHKVGLSDSKKILKFNPRGSGSKISDHGTVDIPVDRLDDVLNESVTFIKIDIEGSELDAIEGSVETILKYHPRLAVCVYHNVGDFWKIPKRILSIREDYKIYLRHYTESIYETVMFFVPED